VKTVSFRGRDALAVATRTRLLDAMLARQIGVKMLCRGRGLCATCHVYVSRNPQCLSSLTEREKLTLGLLTSAQPNSRLACQCEVMGEGVEIMLPRGIYIDSLSELETLIGRRTTAPLLHPVSGRILIEADKIITRSALRQLQDVDFAALNSMLDQE